MLPQQDFSFIHSYFTGEKKESILFLLAGLVACLTAVLFFFFIKSGGSFFKGMAIPLFVIGAILSVVGYTIYARSDRQRTEVAYQTGLDPKGYIRHVELPRMRTVMKNFVVYRYVEIVLLLAGLGLYVYFIRDLRHDFWRGMGLGLAIMAVFSLVADYFAERRGGVYTAEIERLIQ